LAAATAAQLKLDNDETFAKLHQDNLDDKQFAAEKATALKQKK
jgi:hypothetical protein